MTAAMTDAELLAPVEWDPERFGIGVRSIDDQHKHLIVVINTLIRALLQATRATKASVSVAARQSSMIVSPRSNSTSGAFSSNTASLAFAGPSGAASKKFPIVGHRQMDPNFQRGSQLAKIIDDLVSYTAKYLIAEDHMLDTFAYVDRQSQFHDHELFTNEVARAFKLVEDYNMQESDVRRLLQFLKYWIAEHIPRDRKYAPMLIEKGVGS